MKKTRTQHIETQTHSLTRSLSRKQILINNDNDLINGLYTL